MKNIAVIIPTYCEKENITSLVYAILKEIPNGIIFIVDDNSPDGTGKIIDQLSKDFSGQVYTIHRKRKSGRGSAVIEGLKLAFKNTKLKYFLEMDADFSHNPKEIQDLITQAQELQKAVIIGSRYASGSIIVGWPLSRRIFSFASNFFARLVLGLPIRDFTNGFRCYPRKAVEFLVRTKIKQSGYIALSEIAFVLAKAGFTFKEVPTRFVNREKGKSNFSLREIINSIFGIFQIRLSGKNEIRDKLISIFYSLILITTTFLLGQKALNLPWSLVDDGESLRIANKIFETFPNISWLVIEEAERGRLRSAYWLFQAAEFKLFGLNASYHHLFHIGLFAAAAILLYFLTKKLSKSSLAGFFASVFFIFFSPHFENLYRLGPVEVWLTLLLLGIFYILVKLYELEEKQIKEKIALLAITIILFLAALLTKEITAILVPFTFFVVAIFFLKNNYKSKIYAKTLSILGFVLTFVVLGLRIAASSSGITGGYATFYDISSRQIWQASKGYFEIISQSFGSLFWILITSFLLEIFIFILVFKKLPNFQVRLILLVWFVLFLVVQLPWIFIQGRYLTPAIAGLAGFFGVQFTVLLSYLWKFWQKKQLKFWLYPAFVVLLVVSQIFFFKSNLEEIGKVYARVIPSENQNTQVARYFVETVPFGRTIYFNVSEGDEYTYEMPLHFNFFYNRSDLKVDYLVLENPTQLLPGDLIASWTRTAKYSQETIEAHLGKQIKKIQQIGEWTIYVVI